MPGKSNKSKMVSFRLSNVSRAKIESALKAPNNQNTSVSDYCKKVVERHAFRHDKTKYRKARQALP